MGCYELKFAFHYSRYAEKIRPSIIKSELIIVARFALRIFSARIRSGFLYRQLTSAPNFPLRPSATVPIRIIFNYKILDNNESDFNLFAFTFGEESILF